MANIVITSTLDTVKVDFGVYFPNKTDLIQAYYNASEIEKVELLVDCVKVHMLDDNDDWILSHDGSKGFQVDLVDTVAPISLEDLFNKIGVLIKA